MNFYEKFKRKSNYKVDQFIKWYTDNMADTSIGENNSPIEMRSFIEKMAVWYELRYPDYEIKELIPFEREDGKVISIQNSYINELFDENEHIHSMYWDEFNNVKYFIRSLPWEERLYFLKAEYKNIVYWSPQKKNGLPYLRLSKDGYVRKSEFMECVVPCISDKEIKGKHIKEVVKILKEKSIIIPENNEFEKEINNYEKLFYFKEEMLNCVMYRIIKRGGNIIGPRRGYLFAKQFKRNINIPIITFKD